MPLPSTFNTRLKGFISNYEQGFIDREGIIDSLSKYEDSLHEGRVIEGVTQYEDHKMSWCFVEELKVRVSSGKGSEGCDPFLAFLQQELNRES